MKTFLIGLGSIIATFVLLQLVTIDIPNPPKSTKADKIKLPQNIVPLFEKSCNDCHSNHTKWPWYSNIAPISFEVRGHVKDGRAWLNFDIWNQYTQKQKQERLQGIVDTIDYKMPLPMYLTVHHEARLTKDERQLIKEWAKKQIKE